MYSVALLMYDEHEKRKRRNRISSSDWTGITNERTRILLLFYLSVPPFITPDTVYKHTRARRRVLIKWSSFNTQTKKARPRHGPYGYPKMDHDLSSEITQLSPQGGVVFFPVSWHLNTVNWKKRMSSFGFFCFLFKKKGKSNPFALPPTGQHCNF